MPRNSMLGPRRPTTVDQAFRRRDWRPIVVALVLIAGTIAAIPPIVRGLGRLRDSLSSPSPRPAQPPPTDPYGELIAPGDYGRPGPISAQFRGDSLVLEQPWSDSRLGLRAGLLGPAELNAVAQTFAGPTGNDTLTFIAPLFWSAEGKSVRLSVSETSLDRPPGRRLRTVVIDAADVFPFGFLGVELDPPLQLEGGRTYALVIEPIGGGTQISLAYLRSVNFYSRGAVWGLAGGEWRAQVGTLGFRLTFVPGSS